MSKTILITGATDGIGYEAAKILVQKGHQVLLHGRSSEKLNTVKNELAAIGNVSSYLADLSDLNTVKDMARVILSEQKSLDVLINNAGVLNASPPITKDGFDIRFTVNTIAPYLLTASLMPLLNKTARVINLSSAAQRSVNINALLGKITNLDDMEAYAQSKLAITMWSLQMAKESERTGPIIIAVNPGSLLGSKMVKEGFGIEGKDIGIGANILVRLSLDDEFVNSSGQYFDNDIGKFAPPHHDALDEKKCENVIAAIKKILTD